jgi:polyisoprenoid-binding protein YceI
LRPFLAAALFAILACSREQKRPERTEPWPAPCAVPSASARPATERARYEVEKIDITFELPAKRATPRGRLPAATGRFEVDYENPERSSGSLRIDLGLIELEGGDGEGGTTDATRRALEWLELGAEIPAAEREARRFATFSLRALQDTNIGGLGRRRGGQPPHFSATVVGDLSLHGVRAPVRVPVSLEFGPLGAAPPQRLVIRSRRPLVVPLGVHDIRPRDARGVLVARELTLLGESVGREAKVTFELGLVYRP